MSVRRLTGRRRAAVLAWIAAVTIGGCGDSSGPQAGPPARMEIVSGNAQSGTVAAPLAAPLVAKVVDAAGRGVRGASVVWSVTAGAGSIVPVNITSDAKGLASAHWTLGTRAGGQGVSARADALPIVTFSGTATPGALASVAVVPVTASVVQGASFQFTAVASDAYSNVIPGAPVTWSTSNAGVATITTAGVVTGMASDASTTVSAMSAGRTGTATVSVTPPPPLVVETAALDEARLTIAYGGAMAASGGSGVGYDWRVSAGQLPPGVTLSAAGTFTGVPAQLGSFAFTVTVRDVLGLEGSRALTLDVCEAPVELAIGQSLVTPFPRACGIALPGADGAAFRIAVIARNYQTTGTTVSAVPGGLLLRTRATAPGGAAAVGALTSPATFPDDDTFDEATQLLMRATEALHHRLRDEEMREFATAPQPRIGPPSALLAQLAAQSVPAAQRSFFVNDPASQARLSISATLRGQSANLIYYQDDAVSGTTQEATAAEVQNVLDYYDLYGKPLIDGTFGGLAPPGTVDYFLGGPRSTTDLDGNGAVIIVQLHPSNMLSGAAGYVTSCDRSPRPENLGGSAQTCSGSNEGEVFYMLRPSSGFYLGTVVHEIKHISSHGYARFGGRGFNPSWIEEGTADIAKELSSRRAANAADEAELRHAHVFPAGAVPTNATYGMATVHSRARSFLRASPLSGIIGNPNPNPNGSTYYGASWLFHRYLADRYAVEGQEAFFRRMNTTGTGIAAIEAATGQSFATLLSEFATAVAVEGQPAARGATTARFRSYDFADLAAPAGGGTWPYFRATGGFATTSVDLPTYFSAPNFFEFTAAGGSFLRLDVMQANGVPVSPGVDAVLSVVRVR